MIIAIIYFIAILIVCFAIGKNVLAFLSIDISQPEEMLLSISIGIGILSLSTFALGIAGLLYKWLFILVIFVIIILFNKDILKAFNGVLILTHDIKSAIIHNYFNTFIFIVIIILALLNFLAVFAPPSDIDTLTYHFSAPKLYVENHRIYFMLDLAYSNFPFFTEMLFTVGLLIEGSNLAILFTYFFSLATMLSLYLFTKRFISEKAALLTSAIFFSLPIISERSSQAMVEIPLAFYTIVSLYALFLWMERSENKWLMLSAIFSGFVSSIKLTGPFHVVVIIFIMFYWLSFKRKVALSKALNYIAVYAIISFAIVFPWYLKSFIYTGNPVYPFMYEVFGGIYWSDFMSDYLSNALKIYGIGRGLFEYLLLPWNITMHGTFFDAVTGITPVFLGFVPLAFLFRDEFQKTKFLLLYSFAFTTIWFFSSQQARFLLPVFTLLSIVVGSVIIRLLERNVLKPVIILLIAYMLSFNLAISVGINLKKIPVVLGLESKEKYLDNLKDFNPYNVSMFINSLKSAKPLLIGMHRVYYLDTPYVLGNPEIYGYMDYTKLKDEESFAKRLHELGITHIAIERHFTSKIIDGMIPYLSQFLDNNARLIYEHKETKVYELITESP